MSKRTMYLFVGAAICTAITLLLVMQSQDETAEASSDVATQEIAPLVRNDATLVFNTTNVAVEVVDTPETRKRGLSGRIDLSDGAGMLFDFPTVARHGIWMPDMYFALDVLWLDDSFTVVDLAENVTPESYPEVFRPLKPARYVLEVPAGFAAKYNIRTGATSTLTHIQP